MTEEPKMQSEQDSFHVGCMATCSAGIACIAGAIFSAWMFYLTAITAGIIGTGAGAAAICHILMACILLGSITAIIKQRTFIPHIYRVMAALGFAFGYVAMWLLFAFGNLR